MKKLLLIASLSAISTLSVADNIGENYEKGGFILDGYGYLSSNEDYKSSSFYGSTSFLVADGLSFGVNLGKYKYSSKLSDYYSGDVTIGTSIQYAFGYDAAADTGLVYSLGTSVSYQMNSNDTDTANPEMLGGPFFRVDYFLAPRISFYSRVNRFTSISLDPNIVEFEDAIYYIDSISFGISYSFANKDITWNNVTK
ncbi:hypothetical protein [Marinicellulosiphila megalodicopiae]|uniref:hypothetical protein n=1 Tax=Marinicellulosiphila megalodicopiae TaxID=2724896 RepID=UPI003BAE6DF7